MQQGYVPTQAIQQIRCARCGSDRVNVSMVGRSKCPRASAGAAYVDAHALDANSCHGGVVVACRKIQRQIKHAHQIRKNCSLPELWEFLDGQINGYREEIAIRQLARACLHRHVQRQAAIQVVYRADEKQAEYAALFGVASETC